MAIAPPCSHSPSACWPGSLALFPFLGGEFIPILNEGSVTPQTIRLPGISLEKSIEIEKEMQRAVLGVPGSPHGGVENRPDRARQRSSGAECERSRRVAFVPMDQWKTASTKSQLDDAIRRRLQQIPGANFLISQPIQQRVDELVSGVRSEATVKVIGEDLDILRNTAEKNSGHYERHSRGQGRACGQLFGQSYLTIDIDRGKIARHGINVAQIREIITTAIGADAATRVYEGSAASTSFFVFQNNIATASTPSAISS